MKLVLLSFILSISVQAQTAVNARRSNCKFTTQAPQVYVEIPTTVGASTVMVPLCVTIGPGFVLDTLVTPPILKAVLPPATQPTQSWLAIDRIDLTKVSVTNNEYTHTLTRTPVDSSAILAILQGRPFGLIEAVPAAPGRQVVISLPPGPYSAGDAVVLVYMTNDARVGGIVATNTDRPTPVAR